MFLVTGRLGELKNPYLSTISPLFTENLQKITSLNPSPAPLSHHQCHPIRLRHGEQPRPPHSYQLPIAVQKAGPRCQVHRAMVCVGTIHMVAMHISHGEWGEYLPWLIHEFSIARVVYQRVAHCVFWIIVMVTDLC